MVFGTAIALLLLQVSRWLRVALTTGLVLVWSMPVIVAVDIWRWMVDYEFGVANWTLRSSTSGTSSGTTGSRIRGAASP